MGFFSNIFKTGLNINQIGYCIEKVIDSQFISRTDG